MVALRGRITRLERTYGAADPSERRAFLSGYFASPVYDGHRDAIVAALLGRNPSYSFMATDPATGEPTAYYIISRWLRDKGESLYTRVICTVYTQLSQLPAVGTRQPEVPMVLEGPADIAAGILGSAPVVTQYPREWSPEWQVWREQHPERTPATTGAEPHGSVQQEMEGATEVDHATGGLDGSRAPTKI